MSTLMFYNEPVALNKETHRESKVLAPKDFGFARDTNSIVLAGVEFVEAAKEYPIVFVDAGDDKVVPAVILGLRDKENAFIDSDGKWDARYVPAFVRRYPFVLADGNDGRFLICVDKSSLSNDEGQALFDENGEETPYLVNAKNFMQQYHEQNRQTGLFTAKLKKLGLLTEMNAKAVMKKDNSSLMLRGFQVIDEKALLALKDKEALGLFKSGQMAWIYAHLISMGNFSRLVDKIAQREA